VTANEPPFNCEVEPRLFPVAQDSLGSDDYYTPRWVFDALEIRFDLDVCSPPGGVSWIPADRYFTQADDGLAQPWEGRVWMNPPYSDVTPWWRRFVAHRNGIALLPMAKSYWMNAVWNTAEAVVIAGGGGEMHFVRTDNPKPLRIWFPIWFAAFGADNVEAISRIGAIRKVG
jgi:hypothetical protein